MQLIEKISKDLNVPNAMLVEALAKSRRLVKHIKIPKKDRTYRTVYQPSKKLKIIQYWLINNIYKNLAIHPAATAFQKDTSIKDNVYNHKKGKYFLKLDFKDFFPSIHFNDFMPIVSKWIIDSKSGFDDDEISKIIKSSCFYKEDVLPIGYPSSPIISNIVMYEFDSKITTELKDHNVFGKAVYTRYADDLTFSTNIKGACGKIKNIVHRTLQASGMPRLNLNNKKTRFVSASGGSSIITGLRICYDGHVTIHKKYKDKVRLLLSLYRKGKLSSKDVPVLKGHLAYIKYVDGTFYTKLQNVYFESISEIMNA